MAIIKKIPLKGGTKDITLPVFSYGPNDGLARMIVDAWADKDFREKLLERDSHGKVTPAAAQLATWSVNARGGFNLQRAVVISEQEHDQDYTMQADNEVVFVLPNRDRAAPGSGLLETARLLMACTPNGI